MAIDKSLRQHYQGGKIVDHFREGFKTVAGKGADVIGKVADVTSKFAPTDTKTGTFDLGSTVKSYAKSAIQKKIQSAVLSKLGLSFLNPYMGIAALFGFDPFSMAKKTGIMQGFAPGLKLGQKQPPAQYEADRAARQTQSRIDNLLSRKGAGKSYSQLNLNKLTMGSKPGFYGNEPTVSRINIAKNLIGMPEHLGDRGSITPTPTSLVNPIHEARLRDQAIKDKAIKDKAIQEEINKEIRKSLHGNGDVTTDPVTTAKGPPSIISKPAPISVPVPSHISGDGGRGQGTDTPAGGPGGWGPGAKAQGGLIGKPLPGRSRDI